MDFLKKNQNFEKNRENAKFEKFEKFQKKSKICKKSGFFANF